MAKAHIKGYCPICAADISVGDEITYARRGEYAGVRMHPVCYTECVAGRVKPTTESLRKYREVRSQVIAELNGIQRDTPVPAPAPKPILPIMPACPQCKSNIDVKYSAYPEEGTHYCGNSDCLGAFFTPADAAKPATAPTPAPVTGDSLTQAIVTAIWPHIDHKLSTTVDTTTFEAKVQQYRDDAAKYVTEVADALRGEIKAHQTSVQRIEFSTPAVPQIIMDTPHPYLPRLVRALQLGQIPYLYSGAGSGKTHAALDAARVLGYEFDQTYVITCNPFSSPIELTGYTDAHGKLVDKAFLKAFRDGGFVVLDEADRARPDFLPALNSALANDQLVAPDGTCVARHSKFMLVMTGNTTMRGADRTYNSASKQDGSVIDRLFYMPWVYDEALERTICSQMSDKSDTWVSWVHKVRAYVAGDASCTDLLVTMRACITGLRMLCDDAALFTPEEIIDAIIMRGIAADTRKRVLQACPVPRGLARLALPKKPVVVVADKAAEVGA